MSITITEKAVNEIKKVMVEQNMVIEEHALAVGVAGGGCSGFQYSLKFEKVADLGEDYATDVQHGINVGVNKKSEPYLDGTTIDFYSDIRKRGFTFVNPNATRGCGCGTSFSTDAAPSSGGGCGGGSCGSGGCG